jgi:lactoylglutathione lyase
VTEPAPLTAPGVAFDHVGLNVSDLDAMTAWYAGALGLSPEDPFEVPPFQLRGVFLVHPSGYRIELLTRPGQVDGPPSSTPPEAVLTRGYGHLALRVPDVEAAYDSLLANGARPVMPPGPAPRPGHSFAWVADPEGNLVELMSLRD